jgi:nitrate reductase NapE component
MVGGVKIRDSGERNESKMFVFLVRFCFNLRMVAVVGADS